MTGTVIISAVAVVFPAIMIMVWISHRFFPVKRGRVRALRFLISYVTTVVLVGLLAGLWFVVVYFLFLGPDRADALAEDVVGPAVAQFAIAPIVLLVLYPIYVEWFERLITTEQEEQDT